MNYKRVVFYFIFLKVLKITLAINFLLFCKPLLVRNFIEEVKIRNKIEVVPK